MSYKKLDPEFKAKWIKALRSGRYKQVQDALRTADDNGKVGYCCLGVACNVLSPKRWKATEDTWAPDDSFDWGDISTSSTKGLPFASDAACGKLAAMNDEGTPFPAIADWIEAKL